MIIIFFRLKRKFQRCLKSRKSRIPVKRKNEKNHQTRRRNRARAPGKLCSNYKFSSSIFLYFFNVGEENSTNTPYNDQMVIYVFVSRQRQTMYLHCILDFDQFKIYCTIKLFFDMHTFMVSLYATRLYEYQPIPFVIFRIFIFFSGEKDKEKKHKKKLSVGSANIANLLSSSTAKNTSPSATIPSNPTPGPSVVSQGTNSAVTSQSAPAKLLNSSQLSSHGAVKTEPGTSVIVNGNNSISATEITSSTQPDKIVTSSPNTSLQNGIQSGDGNVTEAQEPTLPQCLPADLESCILRLKQAGNDGGTEGKCKFFNSDVNHMLLE